MASLIGLSRLTGNTPLIELESLSHRCGHRILGKCEFLNPNGSVKDRIALAMIKAAEKRGSLIPGKSTIVEATAGNTGIALAALGAARNYKVVVTVSSKMSAEKIALMKGWGAEVVVCPYGVPRDARENYIRTAQILAADQADHYFLDQFSNLANLASHYANTAPEIWRQAQSNVDAVVAGVGTGGTLMGIARYARSLGCATRIVLADPVGSVLAAAVHGRSVEPGKYRIEGIGDDFLPPLFDPTIVTDALSITDDEAISECLALRRAEGLLVGTSSGCAIAAALTFAESLGPERRTIVVVLPDTGRNYLSSVYSIHA
jgi:cystathionine beta-synthase